METWHSTYGRVWHAVFDAGALSVMAGHISLPAYEGLEACPEEALPATLNPQLQINLLRQELQFGGLIVSDAVVMIGISSRVSREEKALQNILAGSDVVLFCDPRADFKYLFKAAREGRLPLARIDQSVRRVLEMKARLGLPQGAARIPLSAEEKTAFAADACAIAEKSITLLRRSPVTPLHLQPGDRVLTVTISHARHRDQDDGPLAEIDAALRTRGLEVEHLDAIDQTALLSRASEFAAVFVNVVMHPHARMGTIRLTGELIMPFWEAFWVDSPNVVFTAFGSPYLLYELPHLPNLYAAFGHSLPTQQAAVRVWLGEIEPRGRCPVHLP